LQPGDFFVLEQPDVDELLNGEAIVMSVLMRTNVDGGDMEDPETVVYRLTVLTTHPAKPTPAMLDPHAPPGLKE